MFIILTVLPLLVAIVLVLIWSVTKRSFSLISITTLLVNTLVSVFFYKQTELVALAHNMGGWQAKIGIEYKLDRFSSIFNVAANLFIFISLLLTYQRNKNLPIFWDVLILVITASINGLAMSNDLFNIYVLLEVGSIAAYGFIALGRTKQSLEASFDAVIYGTIAATLFLLGVGIVYAFTGNLNISAIHNFLLNHSSHKQSLAFVFVIFLFIAALAIKLGAYPFHGWISNNYTQSPQILSLIFIAAFSKVFALAFVKIYYCLLPAIQQTGIVQHMLSLSFIGAAALICIAPAILALFTNNILSFFALSSISQMGYLFLFLNLGQPQSLIIAHFILHSLAKIPLFIVINKYIEANGKVSLSGFRDWVTMRGNRESLIYVVLASMILCGIPPFYSFFVKLSLLSGLFAASQYVNVIMTIVASVLCILYFVRLLASIGTKFEEDREMVLSPSALYSNSEKILLGGMLVSAIGIGAVV